MTDPAHINPNHALGDIREALQQRLFPTLTVWNRLEGRPRSENFDRALAAEVTDPLWMLTRQWQVGEFEGEDAGSPVLAKLCTATDRLTSYTTPAGTDQPLREDLPLQAQVEQRPLAMAAGDTPMSLDIRLLLGRHWVKLVTAAIGKYAADYRNRYPIVAPPADDRDNASTWAHLEAAQRIAAVAGRMMDGYTFYRHLVVGGDPAEGTTIPDPQHPAVRDLAARFVTWFENLILQPNAAIDAWQPARLEYTFTAGTARQSYGAPAYRAERLDWYSLDAGEQTPQTAAPQGHSTVSLLPSALTFDGMPNSRWWAFEAGHTNLGMVTPSRTELGKLLFLEFGLVYANDWFLVPHTVPAGTITRVEALVVTDVFGGRTWVDAVGRSGTPPNQWAMFQLSDTKDPGQLVVLPTAAKVQQGPPLEDVAFVRDEMANMAWAVETTIALPTGQAKPGREAALETAAFHQRLIAAPTTTTTPITPAAPAYQVTSGVDENWIPFIPVHVPGSSRDIQLQRAGMPRLIPGDTLPPQRVRPRTGLLREGLDQQPAAPYYVHEEEVPRSGVRVYRAFRRARWRDGRTVVWFATGRDVGRGSGASGLTFDYLA